MQPLIADAFRHGSPRPAGKRVRAYAGIVVNVDEHEAVLRNQSVDSWVRRNSETSRRSFAGNTGIFGAGDFGRCEEKRRARLELRATRSRTLRPVSPRGR